MVLLKLSSAHSGPFAFWHRSSSGPSVLSTALFCHMLVSFDIQESSFFSSSIKLICLIPAFVPLVEFSSSAFWPSRFLQGYWPKSPLLVIFNSTSTKNLPCYANVRDHISKASKNILMSIVKIAHVIKHNNSFASAFFCTRKLRNLFT